MSWRPPRRVRLASGVHLNVGKRGFSWSFGGAPFTINLGPRGVYQTFSLPGTGLSYRQKVGRGAHSRSGDTTSREAESIDHEVVSQVKVVDSTPDALLKEINDRAKRGGLFRWVLAATIILGLLQPIFLFLGAYPLYWVYKRDQRIRTTEISYTLDSANEKRFEALQAAFGALGRSQSVWLVTSATHHGDWKRHAGATQGISRKACRPATGLPRLIRSNIAVPFLRVAKETLYFFPDRIIVETGRKYRSFDYSEVTVDSTSSLFVESASPPSDGTIVQWTWQYVRKDGGPDRRFNNNRQLPVLQYGELDIRMGMSSRLVLQTSRLVTATEFASLYAAFRGAGPSQSREQTTRDAPNQEPPRHRQRAPGPSGAQATHSPWRVLGLEPGATRDAIDAAYRAQAKLYHPDRVAHLGPDLREMAEKKMKEINAAYTELTVE